MSLPPHDADDERREPAATHVSRNVRPSSPSFRSTVQTRPRLGWAFSHSSAIRDASPEIADGEPEDSKHVSNAKEYTPGVSERAVLELARFC